MPARAPHAPSPAVRRHAGTELFFVSLILFVVPLIDGVTRFLWPPEGPVAPPEAVYLNAAMRKAARLALVLYLIARCRQPAGRFGLVRPRGSDVLDGLVLLVAAVVVGVAVYTVLSRAGLGGDRSATHFFPPLRGPDDYALALTGALAIGLTEEVVYRAYLLTRVEQLTGSAAAGWAVSTAVFGAMHIYLGPVGLANASALGCLLGVWFVRARRVWPGVLAHVGYDLVAFAAI